MTRVASVVLNNFTADNRVYKTAKSLQNAGYDVTVVALLKGDVQEHEVFDGIPVHRIKLKTMRLPEGVIWGGIKYLEMFYRIIRNYRKFNIWHCNDFEPFLIGRFAKIFNRKLKLVYDCHEYESERYGKAKAEKWFIAKAEKAIIKHAEQIINVSEGIESEYKRLYGVTNTHLVFNSPHFTTVESSDKLRQVLNIPPDKRIFLYQGGLTVSRGIELLLETFAELGHTDNVVVFMGKGKYQAMIDEYVAKHSNIYYHPQVPYDKLISYTASADYGVISTQNLCLNNYYCMPNKLFEYIHAEIPILTNNLFDCRNMVEGHGLGIVAEEYSKEALIKAVDEIAQYPKSHFVPNLKKMKDQFSWEKEEIKLIDLYKLVG
jgi:glycosyltransferase involved in cell wall biosynthesis